MTRFQRISPVLLGALMAACSEAQPYVQPVAPLAASAVVVDAGLGDRTAKLDLRAAAAYALQTLPSGATVHRWVPADLVRYDVELRVRNATVATQYDAIGSGLTAQIPVNAQGAGTATFTKLSQGKLYRAYVKAMGKEGGASAQGTEVQMNAAAQNDHVDFDFTAANDVASEVNRTVTVNFDNVAFSGTGALSFGTPSPGAFVGPSEGPAVAVSNPPSASASPSPSPSVSPSPAAFQLQGTFTVGTNPRGLAVDSQGNAWVSNHGSGNLTKLASNGSVLGTFTVAAGQVSVDAQDQVWVATASRLVKLASSGSVLTSYLGSTTGAVLFDQQGQLWVPSGVNLVKRASNGSILGTFNLGTAIYGVVEDLQQHIWASHSGAPYVTKLASNGSILGTFDLGGANQGLGVDAQGHIWVSKNHTPASLIKLASNGSVLASLSVSGGNRLVLGANGDVWVGSSEISRVSNAGNLLQTLNSNLIGNLAFRGGSLWVGPFSGSTVSLYR